MAERGIGMTSLIVAVIVLIIVGAAIAYIVKEKKRGVRCIGCPAAGNCPSRDAGHGCGCQSDAKK